MTILTRTPAPVNFPRPNHYMGRVERNDNLTHTELNAMLAEAKSGSQQARQRIVEHFVPTVITIVARNYGSYTYAGRVVSTDDLIQVGALSIFKAIDYYRPGWLPFPYLVQRWVHREIRYELIQISGPLRLPMDSWGVWRKWCRIRQELADELLRMPARAEIIKRGKFSERQADLAETVDRRRSKVRSKPARLRGSRARSYEAVEPHNDQEKADLRLDVAEAMGRLPARQAGIVRTRYGLDGETPLKLREVAEREGVSIGTVFHHEQHALATLAAMALV